MHTFSIGLDAKILHKENKTLYKLYKLLTITLISLNLKTTSKQNLIKSVILVTF